MGRSSGSRSSSSRSSGSRSSSSRSSGSRSGYKSNKVPNKVSNKVSNKVPNKVPNSSNNKGFFSNMFSTAAGTFMGFSLARMIFGNHISSDIDNNEITEVTNTYPCYSDMDNFSKCLKENPNEISKCQIQYDLLIKCNDNNKSSMENSNNNNNIQNFPCLNENENLFKCFKNYPNDISKCQISYDSFKICNEK